MVQDPITKLTPQDFAAKIKAKYPQYQSLEDSVLVERMLAKYPQYKDTIDFGQPTGQPVTPEQQDLLNREVLKATNPLLQTPGLGDFAISAGNQIGSVITDLVPQTIAQLQLKSGSGRLREMERMAQNPAFATPAVLAEIERLKAAIPQKEQEIATQKAEAAQKLAGNKQEITEIKSATDFANWLGNSIGQAAGQIPLSAATFGTSSFLMEAATIYDEQLDLLAEKHGISRQEVIDRGLDKPAEGEVYALIAGGIDAVSAGSIMKLFKAAAGKELKKNVIKSILKDMAGEAVTEGAQGQLETFGATRGAGTEFTFDVKKFINEAAAGAVGAGGLSVITSQDKETAQAIKDAEELVKKSGIDNITTGDPALDAELESAYTAVADQVTKYTKEVDDFVASKSSQDLADAKKAAQEAEARAKAAEDELFRRDKFAEFESSPTVRPDLPISEEEAQWGDESAAQLLQNEPTVQPTQGGAPVETTTEPVAPTPTGQTQQGTQETVQQGTTPTGQRTAETTSPVLTQYHTTDSPEGIQLDDNFEQKTMELGSGFMHIGTSEAARQRANEDKKTPRKTYEVTLNPNAKLLDVDDTGEPLHIQNVLDGLLKAGDITTEQHTNFSKDVNTLANEGKNDDAQRYVANIAKGFGYDATRYANKADGAEYSYGVMTKNAIKSIKEVTTKDAVQKSSTKGVDVQQQTTDGKEVGEAYTQKQKAAQEEKQAKIDSSKEFGLAKALDQAEKRHNFKPAAEPSEVDAATKTSYTYNDESGNPILRITLNKNKNGTYSTTPVVEYFGEKPAPKTGKEKREAPKKRQKSQEEIEDNYEASIQVMERHLENAKEYKPKKRTERLAELEDKASRLYNETQYAGFKRILNDIQAAIKKDEKEREEKAAEMEAKKAKAAAKEEALAKEEPTDGREAKRKVTSTGKKRFVKKEPKMVEFQGKTVPVHKVRDYFLNNIAKLIYREAGQDAINKEIAAYIQYRIDNGLKMVKPNKKPITPEAIRKDAEARVSQIGNKINKGGIKKFEKEEAAKLKNASKESEQITEEARQQKTPDQIKIEREQRERDEEEALRKGLEDNEFFEGEDIGDIEFLSKNFNRDVASRLDKDGEPIAAHIFRKSKITKITAEQYINLADPQFRGILRTLFNIIQKQSRRLKLEFVTATMSVDEYNMLSFDASYFQNNRGTVGTIVIPVGHNGKPHALTTHTLIHELVHPYTSLMASVLYKNNRNFSNDINAAYLRIDASIGADLINIAARIAKGKTLTYDEQNLIDAVNTFLPHNTFEELIEGYVATGGKISPMALDNFILEHVTKMIYGLSQPTEMLSEMFSNPKFIHLLSRAKINEKINNGLFKGEQKSALYKIYETFVNFLKKNVIRDLKWDPVSNNAYEYILDKLQTFDAEFSNEKLERDKSTEGVYTLLYNRKKPLSGKQILTKIRDTMARQLELKEGIQSENDVRKFIQNLNKRLPAKSQISEDAFAPAVWNEIDARRKTLKADIDRAKLAIDWMKKQPEYKKQNSKFAYDVNLYEQVDFTKLTAAERNKVITKGMVPLAYNNVNVSKETHNIVLKNIANQRVERLVKLSPKLKKGSWMRTLLKGTNIMTATSALGKFKTQVADELVKLLHADFLWAATQSGVEANEFYHNLEDIAKKGNLTHKNLANIGMLGRIFSTENNKDAEPVLWTEEVKANAEFVLESAQAKLQAFNEKIYTGSLKEEQIKKEVEIATKINKHIQNGELEIKNYMTKEEQKFYDAMREFASKHEAEFFRNTKAVWGEEPKQLNDYFPSLAQGKLGLIDAGALKTDPLLRDGSDSLFEALSNSDLEVSPEVREKSVNSRKFWGVYSRKKNPKGYYYEYDALGLGKKWSKNMLFDTYASTPLKLVDKLLKDKKSLEAVGGTRNLKALRDQIKSSAASGMRYDEEVPKVIKKFMGMRDAMYMAAIVTSGQYVLQLSSGVAASAVIAANINPLKMASTMAKATKAATLGSFNLGQFRNFLEENGLGIQLRDIGFEKHLTPDDFKSYTSRARTTAVNWANNASDYAMRTGDKMAARMVWFAVYFDAGGTLEKPNREAILRAERITGTLQNMSDARWTAPVFKSNSTAYKILLGMFYAYKSFSLNAWMGMMTSLGHLNNKEARMVAAAQFGSYVAYHAATVALVRPLWEAVGKALGGDDDEDEEEKNFTAIDEIATNVAWDVLVNSYMPGVVDQILRYGVYKSGAAETIWGNEDEEFNQYVDSPLFMPTKAEKIYESALGPGIKELISVPTELINGMSIYREAQLADEAAGIWEQDPDNEYYQRLSTSALSAGSDLFGMASGLPFRGDIRRLMKSTLKERRADERRAKELMGRGGKGSGTNIDGEQQFDSTNYIDFSDIDSWTNENSFENQ